MKILSFFTRKREPAGLPAKQASRREKELRVLVATGHITLAQIEGNHKAKELFRLRQLGYVHRNGHHNETWAVNPSTGCKYKVYCWTGKMPPHWVKTSAYTGHERRAKMRVRKG